MGADSQPFIFIEGIDVIIRRDLQKHKKLLEQAHREEEAYQQSHAQLIARKKHYRKLIGGGKFDDDALKRAMNGIAIDIRAMSDKIKLSKDAIEHHRLIVNTLTGQLADYEKQAEIARSLGHAARH